MKLHKIFYGSAIVVSALLMAGCQEALPDQTNKTVPSQPTTSASTNASIEVKEYPHGENVPAVPSTQAEIPVEQKYPGGTPQEVQPVSKYSDADIAAMNEALASKDVKKCDSITNTDLKNQCVSNLTSSGDKKYQSVYAESTQTTITTENK